MSRFGAAPLAHDRPNLTKASVALRLERHHTAKSVVGTENSEGWKKEKGAHCKQCAPSVISNRGYRPKYAAFLAVNSFHFSGRSSSAKTAETGHTGTHAPQSIHSTGSM